MTVKNTLLACLLLLASQPLIAETYKWVNEEGVVTYSQTPPPDQKSSERVKLRGSKSSNPQSGQSRLNQLRQSLADSAEDREMEKEKLKETEEERALKRHNCDAAHSNLRKLEGLGNRRYKMDGEYRRLSEEERQSLMQQERDHIKSNCGG
jgi:hypothetical protein